MPWSDLLEFSVAIHYPKSHTARAHNHTYTRIHMYLRIYVSIYITTYLTVLATVLVIALAPVVILVLALALAIGMSMMGKSRLQRFAPACRYRNR